MKEALVDSTNGRRRGGPKNTTTKNKAQQTMKKILTEIKNSHPLTDNNSPPLEGWIRPTGEDGVVKKNKNNK